MDNKTLYTIIVHSENFAGLLNQVTAVFTRRRFAQSGDRRVHPPANQYREPERFGIFHQGRA